MPKVFNLFLIQNPGLWCFVGVILDVALDEHVVFLANAVIGVLFVVLKLSVNFLVLAL